MAQAKKAGLEQPAVTATSRYEVLRMERDPFLRRAQEAARLTIPALMPPDGYTGTMQLYTPFQSVGARGVNNLSSKLLLAMFPPGNSFFRLGMDEMLMDEAKERLGEDALADFEAAFGKIERGVVKRMEHSGSRTELSVTLQHLVVCGNGLLQVMDKGKLKLHPLDRYVVKRDLASNVLEIIVKESLSRSALEGAALEVANRIGEDAPANADTKSDSVDLYTRVVRGKRGGFSVHQEIGGYIVPGTQGTYPKDKSAWLPLRFSVVPGADYGQSYVDQYIGDVQSLESLSQALVEFASNAAWIVYFVERGGLVSKKQLERARSGSVLDGNAKDVSALTLDRPTDFSVIKATADNIEQRLAQAFLLNSSVQRQAERVTAEEIRFMAGELEQALGGVYSILAQELQLPLVHRLMHQMQREGKLPALPEDTVQPSIITGLDGLGRSSDLMKWDLLLAGVAQHVGPEAVAEYVSAGGLLRVKATALGLDTAGVVRTEEEVQASREAASQADMTAKLAAPAAGLVAKGAELQANQQQQPTQ